MSYYNLISIKNPEIHNSISFSVNETTPPIPACYI